MIHIFTLFFVMEVTATFHNIVILLGSIKNRPVWSVTCKNDNSAGLFFLVMSPDPYFNFISGPFLSNHLKYFNDTL